MIKEKKPSFLTAISVFIGIILILGVGISVYKVDIHILLVMATFFSSIVAYKCGFGFDEILDGMTESIKKAMIALIIFILIGMMIGSWIASGTVPGLIYYGLELLSPKFFLPTGLIICSITSLATGTSWGTTGTVGLALMGMGVGLGIPGPVVAGMVVSGAFFGDKMSPMSDSTILAAASTDTDLYDHIGGMLITSVPAYIISLVLYTFVGFHYATLGNSEPEQIHMIHQVLGETFNLKIIVLLPIVVVLVLSLMKVPSVIAMSIGTFLGTIFAVVFQGADITYALKVLNYGYVEKTGLEVVDKLLVRGGIQNMMWTFSLSFIALCLGGVLEKAGFLNVIVEKVLAKVKSIPSVIAVSMGTTFLTNLCMGEIYLALILNGNLYRKVYKDKGLENKMLSRVLEESGTLTGALIPWTTAGAFIAGSLGVSTLSYVPFAFFNLINPILSIIMIYCGFSLYKIKSTD